ncbi:MAG TPA: 50S ribosomal protein L25 [Solirubrobacteraceae bacterium]|jgi:large subunit ribosomal protein L25|nr:50S ribosomal protein L25 [Solirubrobacteraceae bacterium]
MATNQSTALQAEPREANGSREARRLRRAGNVPGVLYGGGDEPLSFQVSARTLRQVLASAGAVLDFSIDGASTSPAVLKDLVRHPVSGETLHVDLLRVRLDQAIQSTVVLELTGVEDAPGVKEGGVMELVTRELTIEALPNDIPDGLTHDVSQMQIGDTLTLDALRPPSTVTLLDDPETVIATLTPPRLQVESEDEIEQETQVVGEGEAAPEDSAEGGDAEAAGDSDDE